MNAARIRESGCPEKKVVVQIVGACWVNKGDRLMVESLRQRLGSRYYLPLPVWLNTPASKLWGPANMSKMFAQGIYRLGQTIRHGRPDVILDCSGYQYGDPWARMVKALCIRLSMYQYFVGKGGRMIMLPQSVGPFQHQLMSSVAAGVFRLADRLFVRDEVSRQHALSVGCPPERLTIAPDYSNLVAPHMPEHPEEWARRILIVPSVRMLDKTSSEVSSSYLQGLQNCIELIREVGFDPCVLVHDLEDRALAEVLREKTHGAVPVFDPPPPLAKGMLASCRAVVASRYHALVGALCQSTPAIGTGWTHKYRVLFRDYGCEELLVPRLDSRDELRKILRLVSEEASRSALVSRLDVAARTQRSRTLAMYDELEHVLDAVPHRRK